MKPETLHDRAPISSSALRSCKPQSPGPNAESPTCLQVLAPDGATLQEPLRSEKVSLELKKESEDSRPWSSFQDGPSECRRLHRIVNLY